MTPEFGRAMRLGAGSHTESDGVEGGPVRAPERAGDRGLTAS
jgi:hypothetical protein